MSIERRLDQHHFAAGLNNLPSGHLLQDREGSMPFPYPPRWGVYFDDFFTYTAAQWVVTEAAAATQTIADLDGGNLLLTNTAVDTETNFLQSTGELFTFAAGKKLYFEARWRLNEVIQVAAVMGLQVRDTTPLAVADGVFFQTDDGDALLDFHSLVGSVDTASLGIATLAAGTFVKTAFLYDGGTNILVAINDAVVGSVTVTPTATELTISFGSQNGEAVAKIMTVDWILVAKER